MNKTIYLLMFVFLIFLFTQIDDVNADWLANGACEKSTTCTIARQLVNDTSGESISIASCNITIRSPTNITSILINNQPMNNLSNGWYDYDIDFDVNGYYPSTMQCNYFTSVDVADVSFSVIDREADKKLITFPIMYILLVIGWVILIIGFWKQETTLVMLSAMLLTILGILILVNGIDGTRDWVTNSFGVINLGIGFYFLGKWGIEWIQEYM